MLLRYCTKLIRYERRINNKICNYSNISEASVEEPVGKRSKVQGWVKALRKMKDNIFIDVNDGTSSQHMQVVIKKSNCPKDISYGSCISATGEVAYAPNGREEIRADEVNVIGGCNLDGYPFLPRKQYDDDYIRQYLHLRMRTRKFSCVLRLRDLVSITLAEYMHNRGFINIHTPILTSNDCEGAGEIFITRPESTEILESMKKDKNQLHDAVYFNAKTFLTVSGQLHLETMARALTRVYTFGPTFRAENSKSRLHLSEFYMMEAELAFISDIKELVDEIELFIKTLTSIIVEKGANDMQTLEAKPPDWLNKNFGVLTYDEAQDILQRHSDQLSISPRRGDALPKDHELFLVKHNGGTPVFIINWPKKIKPFYMKECADDSSKVAALDLLMPVVGELIGGSLREDNYEKLKDKLTPNSNLSWYLDLRKYGNVPTGGFGMGFERYLQVVLGIYNIKDVIPFPRWPHNCSL